MFDCVGYVFGSGLVFRIDKKEKRKKGKKGQKRGWEVWVGGVGRKKKKRIELHLLFLICRVGARHR